jgi:hypothetical protein
LITDAPEDPEKELRHREIRYVIMMLTRAGCLVVGAIIVSARPPLWPLWLVLCVVAMVLLPWLAVILANDRPPKTRAERAAARRGRDEPRALPSHGPDRVIDADDFSDHGAAGVPGQGSPPGDGSDPRADSE